MSSATTHPSRPKLPRPPRARPARTALALFNDAIVRHLPELVVRLAVDDPVGEAAANRRAQLEAVTAAAPGVGVAPVGVVGAGVSIAVCFAGLWALRVVDSQRLIATSVAPRLILPALRAGPASPSKFVPDKFVEPLDRLTFPPAITTKARCRRAFAVMAGGPGFEPG